MLPFWIQKHKTVWPNGITRFYLKGKQQFFTLCCEKLLCRDTCEGECHKVTGVCRLQRANSPL